MDVAGNVALVTGGASGLGRATGEALAAAGAHVVLVDLPGSDGEVVAERLGGGARFVAADVTDEAQAREAVELAVSLGPLRVVVSCAGIVQAKRLVGRDGLMPLAGLEQGGGVNLPGSDGEVVAERLGGGARFVAADVTDEAQAREAVELAVSLGPLRVVVSCAGIVQAKRLVGRDGLMPLAGFEQVVRVNLLGTV